MREKRNNKNVESFYKLLSACEPRPRRARTPHREPAVLRSVKAAHAFRMNAPKPDPSRLFINEVSKQV